MDTNSNNNWFHLKHKNLLIEIFYVYFLLFETSNKTFQDIILFSSTLQNYISHQK